MNCIIISDINKENKNKNHLRDINAKYCLLNVYSEFYDVGTTHLSDLSYSNYFLKHMNFDYSSIDSVLISKLCNKKLLNYLTEPIQNMLSYNNFTNVKYNYIKDIQREPKHEYDKLLDNYMKNLDTINTYGNNLINNNLMLYTCDYIYPELKTKICDISEILKTSNYRDYFFHHYNFVRIYNSSSEDYIDIFIQNESQLFHDLILILYIYYFCPWSDRKYTKRIHRYMLLIYVNLLSKLYINNIDINESFDIVNDYIYYINNIIYEIFNIFKTLRFEILKDIDDIQKCIRDGNDLKQNINEKYYNILENINSKILLYQESIQNILYYIYQIDKKSEIINTNYNSFFIESSSFINDIIMLITYNYHIQTSVYENILSCLYSENSSYEDKITHIEKILLETKAYFDIMKETSQYSLNCFKIILTSVQQKYLNIKKDIKDDNIKSLNKNLSLKNFKMSNIIRHNSKYYNSVNDYKKKPEYNKIEAYQPLVIKNKKF